MDSTRAIISLWQLCAPQSGQQEAGSEGAIALNLLKHVLQSELQGKEETLGCRDVDDILERYLQPDTSGVVGFLQFWHGMEKILEACNTHRTVLCAWRKHALVGFKFLRQCILDYAPVDKSQGRSVFSVRELRFWIRGAAKVAADDGPGGESFWKSQAESLPDDETLVTGEEVATALLEWLKELVDVDDDGDEDSSSPARKDQEMDDLNFVGHKRPSPPPQYEDAPSHDSMWLRLPSDPIGPPPQRTVNSGKDSDVASSGAAKRSPSQRKASELETGLAMLLRRPDKRKGGLRKEEAAEWRDSMEFSSALRRRLLEQPAAGEENTKEFTFADFHALCLSLVKTTSRRSSTRGCSPRLQSKCYNTAAQALFISLHSIQRRQKSDCLNTWRRSWRAAKQRECGFDLFGQMLKMQCETAKLLEQRATYASRAGGLAQCLERLVRTSMKGVWGQWSKISPPRRNSQPSASPNSSLPAQSPNWRRSSMPSAGSPSGQPPARLPKTGQGRGRGSATSPSSPQDAVSQGGYPGTSRGGVRSTPFNIGGSKQATSPGLR